MAELVLTWTWTLQGSPEALWPWVADTDFTNRAAGLEPVSYAWEAQPQGGRRRLASSNLGPLKNRWVESPYDWAEPSRFGVEREFQGGPIERYRSQVQLEAQGQGRTLLTHTLTLHPRLSVLGPALRLLGMGLKRGFDKAYRAAEAAAAKDAAQEALGEPNAPMLAALVSQDVAPALARRLAAYVLHAPPRQAEHMRPFTLADAWGVDRQELLGACFAACRLGFLEPRWALRCPHCLGPKGLAPRLAQLSAQASCEDCQATFGARLDRNAELAFRPVPELRPPLAAIYCLAGPAASKHIVAQGALGPGQSQVLELSIAGGPYRLRTGTQALADLTYDPDAPAGVPPQVGLQAPQPEHLVVGGPRLCLTLTHGGSAGLLPFALESVQGREVACPVAVAIAHPDFSRSFPGDGLAPEPSHDLDSLCLWLPIGVAGPSALGLGRHGIVAQGPGGGSLFAFLSPAEALAAALGGQGPVQGAVLVEGPVTMTGQWEAAPLLSGPTVELALRLAASAPPGPGLVLGGGLLREDAVQGRLLVEGFGEGQGGPEGSRHHPWQLP